MHIKHDNIDDNGRMMMGIQDKTEQIRAIPKGFGLNWPEQTKTGQFSPAKKTLPARLIAA